jgi:post-segregation antitoxin (ccd killing protein)
VDVDFIAYRKANENRAVKKTLTIPSWLNAEAEKAGINFSRVLQDALMQKLNVSR